MSRAQRNYDDANLMIGRQIRQIRLHRRLSLQALGRTVGIQGKRLGEYERGEVTLPAPLMVALAYRLGCEVDVLAPPRRMAKLMER